MARYYLDKELTIDGFVPGSTVAVWRGNNTHEDPLYLQTTWLDKARLKVPDVDENIFIRIRHIDYRSFEKTMSIQADCDGRVRIRQQRAY